jgi:ABC-2 type transport system permease protein
MTAGTLTERATSAEAFTARTLTVATELRRQASRPRTRIALTGMIILPLIILAAFEFGQPANGADTGNGADAFDNLVTVATSSGLNFALFTLLVSSTFLLVVVFALFFGDTVASEASWGSLRYLLAIPVPRARLLGVKLVVSAIYSLVALVLLVGTALIAGMLRYGWRPLNSTVSDNVAPTDGLRLVWLATGYIAITLIVVASIAFLLSVSTDHPLGAVGGAVMLQIVSSILNQISALGNLRNFLPSHYSTAWVGLLSTPTQWTAMIQGTISALIYGVVFFGLAFWRFVRKDIVS